MKPPRKADYSKWATEVTKMGMRAKIRDLEIRSGVGAGRGGIDWLCVAIYNMGGILGAAKALKVEPATIYNWLNGGLGGLPFNRIVKISQLGEVPLDSLARRLGPFVEEGDAKR